MVYGAASNHIVIKCDEFHHPKQSSSYSWRKSQLTIVAKGQQELSKFTKKCRKMRKGSWFNKRLEGGWSRWTLDQSNWRIQFSDFHLPWGWIWTFEKLGKWNTHCGRIPSTCNYEPVEMAELHYCSIVQRTLFSHLNDRTVWTANLKVASHWLNRQKVSGKELFTVKDVSAKELKVPDTNLQSSLPKTNNLLKRSFRSSVHRKLFPQWPARNQFHWKLLSNGEQVDSNYQKVFWMPKIVLASTCSIGAVWQRPLSTSRGELRGLHCAIHRMAHCNSFIGVTAPWCKVCTQGDSMWDYSLEWMRGATCCCASIQLTQ